MSTPPITIEEASRVAVEVFGISGDLRMLGSCQDANFLLRTASGDAYVLKVSSATCTYEDIEFQNSLMVHLCGVCEVSLPVHLPANKKESIGTILLQDTPYFVRLLKYVEGEMLSDFEHLTEASCQRFGAFVATISQALANISSTYSRDIQWDMCKANDVIQAYLSSISDVALQKQLSEGAARGEEALVVYKSTLRRQVVHCDLATYNIIAQRCDTQPIPSGVIDFGDAIISWLVGDLAIAITSSLNITDTPDACLLQVMNIVKGFHTVYPLLGEEIMALWPLILQRTIVNIVLIQHELNHDASNAYNIEGLRNELHTWQIVSSIDMRVAQEALRYCVGLPPLSAWSTCSPLCDTLIYDVLDCGVFGEVNIDGNWLQADSFAVSIQEMRLQHPNTTFLLPYGKSRMYYTSVPSLNEPATVPLTLDLLLCHDADIRAPFDCTVETIPKGLVLRGKELSVYVYGASGIAGEVSAGAVCGVAHCNSTYSSPYIGAHISIHVTRLDHPVQRCTPSLFPVYQRLCMDPAELISATPSTETGESSTVTNALEKRRRSVAAVQEHYYECPPQIERGWKEYLYDTQCRAYVDMVNNVAVVGHSHPDITAAATKQLKRLNTNSRFVYNALGSFADKILSTIPQHAKHALNTVLFVNSGSEATDLALRIARTVISARRNTPLQRDVICLAGAYHGITTASDEISTTLNDNPRALQSRPEWVHLVAMPNMYRGKYTGDNAMEKYVKEVKQAINSLRTQQQRSPVVFIAEPLSGNAGGVELPAGYLEAVYKEVRAAGGLCISDEVQVGYGRLGRHFWGFEEHGVVPDLLTMAKAAGNGFPLGYVITSREIATEFGVDGSFFSSAGGGPVGCAVGSAVLDIILHQRLQENAAVVGEYLHLRLLEVKNSYPDIVGCIHGHGLYQGIELVRNGKPATREAYMVCEHLLQLGVICHNTGDFSNVLKVKPPLVITKDSADFITQALHVALRGWKSQAEQ